MRWGRCHYGFGKLLWSFIFIKYHFQQALNVLTKIAADSSLRYAIQLITSSALSAKKAKRTEVTTQDIRKVYNLFLDEKRSTDYLKEYQKFFLYGENQDIETPKMEVTWMLTKEPLGHPIYDDIYSSTFRGNWFISCNLLFL